MNCKKKKWGIGKRTGTASPAQVHEEKEGHLLQGIKRRTRAAENATALQPH